MNRRNYFFRKKIDTPVMDDLQDNIENASKALIKNLWGENGIILTGCSAVEKTAQRLLSARAKDIQKIICLLL